MAEPEVPEDDGGGGGYTPPPITSGDWDKIDDFTGDVTIYKSVSFSFLDTSAVIDLSGSYVILSLDADEIVLSNPELINSDWEDFDETVYASPSLSTNGIAWVGPFDVDLDETENNQIIVNLVAPQGVYGIDKKGEQYARSVTATVEIWPIAKDGTVLGATETFGGTIVGSNTEKKQLAITIVCTPTFTGRARVRVRRTSPTDLDPKRQAIDNVQWDTCFGLGVVEQDHFGDVTTVFARTYATQSATAVKERRLNALVTRKVPLWDGTAFGALTAQTDAAAIICAIALDPKIGNRVLGELNVPQIYAETEALRAYFGIDEATDFNYTFDDDNFSFEETISAIAQNIFCTAYRLGNVIHLYGEMATDNSLLLFNHRNKLPKSETRTVTFGAVNDYDGLELSYVDPNDDATKTIYLPSDQSARNPRKIDTVGIRNEMQAMLHAKRAYNKILYQNTTTQFDGLEEAEFLINNNRVLIADNTRADTHDGYVKAQVGLVIELSQPFVPMDDVEYTIFLQHYDGTVQSMMVEPGADQWHAVLETAPALPLSLGAEQSVVAHYWIVGDNEPRASAFLLTEKEPSGKNTFSVTAINYDDRYYTNDKDFSIITTDTDTITVDSDTITADGSH